MSAALARRWGLLAVLVLAEIGYPLTTGQTRAGLVVLTVIVGYAASVAHAMTRGVRAATALIAVTTGGGLAVEAIGVGTGFPFGEYEYSGALGPRLAGVPVIIAMAWTWMAWPAWLAAGRLVSRRDGGRLAGAPMLRIGVAGLGLAAWDLFLDPQMVAERYWQWTAPSPTLPGVPDIPISNYLGWLGVAIGLMALLAWCGGPAVTEPADRPSAGDAPMLALYLWTYASSVLAHAAFLGLPASAGWGALGMGLVAVPLAWRLAARWVAARRVTGVPA